LSGKKISEKTVMQACIFWLTVLLAVAAAQDATPSLEREHRQLRLGEGGRDGGPSNRREDREPSYRGPNRRKDGPPLQEEVVEYDVLEERKFKGGYGDHHIEMFGQGHKGGYGPPPKCHPQTVTKYNTVYKERKALVYNKVEVRNPRPQVYKTKETRHTTIRYPVFITQVIKPLLTQVETKVKPMFFTKTLKRIKTILFTVTGIGQVTVTSVKYEKEYVTRCNKKSYGHGGHGGHDKGHGGHGGHGYGHRREDTPDIADIHAADVATKRADRGKDFGDKDGLSPSKPQKSDRYKRDASDLSPSIVEFKMNSTQVHQATNPLLTSV